ncbi:MAG: PH domain-containing protein [Chloroflexota bacterium]
MSEKTIFYPPLIRGRLFHTAMIILLTAGGLWGLVRVPNAQVGPAFLIELIPTLLALPLVPFLSYRIYTLHNAQYILARDDLQLKWGWRVEVIPMNNIEWILPASDLETPIRLPWLRWPGAILGQRRIPDGRLVEFLATKTDNLLLISTTERIYAISPSDPNAFLQAHQRIIELGSLNVSISQSIYPSFLWARVWKTLPARYLLIAGAILCLVLLAWTSLAIGKYNQISLGFTPQGLPNEPLPSIQLMLLPFLSISAYIFNSILGFFLYRREDQQIWAYILWGNSVLVVTIFLFAINSMLRGI